MEGSQQYLVEGPGHPDGTVIYLPNRLVGARFGQSGLLHLRIFIAVLKQLQPILLAGISDKAQHIGEPITDTGDGCVALPLALKEITAPNHYPQAVDAAKKIGSLCIRIRQTNVTDGNIVLKDIFHKVGLPRKIAGTATFYVHIKKQTVEALTKMDRRQDGRAVNFTGFGYATAMSISSKHTLRLYILISSWKNRGGFHIKLDDLKEMLGIGNGYRNFSVFRTEILLPAQRELETLGDCWFNAAGPGFRKKEGGKVTGLNFKVITKKSQELGLLQVQQFEHILRLHAGFRDRDMAVLKPLTENRVRLDELIVKVVDLVRKRTDGNGKPIRDRVAYITRALLES